MGANPAVCWRVAIRCLLELRSLHRAGVWRMAPPDARWQSFKEYRPDSSFRMRKIAGNARPRLRASRRIWVFRTVGTVVLVLSVTCCSYSLMMMAFLTPCRVWIAEIETGGEVCSGRLPRRWFYFRTTLPRMQPVNPQRGWGGVPPFRLPGEMNIPGSRSCSDPLASRGLGRYIGVGYPDVHQPWWTDASKQLPFVRGWDSEPVARIP